MPVKDMIRASLDKRGPYKGLEPYSQDDSAFFFGREAERQIIIANLTSARLTLLYGPTGVGKTSLLHAGVIRDLRAMTLRDIKETGSAHFLPVAFSAWHSDPVPGLINAMRESASSLIGAEMDQSQATSLPEAIAAWTAQTGVAFLIILDQFEEYFAYHEDRESGDDFLLQIPLVLENLEVQANILISIREDALAKLDIFKSRIPNLFENYLRMRHLDVLSARAAIEKPIEQFNVLFPEQPAKEIEPELVEAVLEQLADRNLASYGSARQSSPVEVKGPSDARVEGPFLQLIMDRLWTEELQAGSKTLRKETFLRLGGARKIVENHLDEAMGALSRKDQDVAADVFRFLVTPGGSKIAHRIGDLCDYAKRPIGDVLRVVGRLSDPRVRVLRPAARPDSREADAADSGAGGVRFEIAHDVLAGPILQWRIRHLQSKHRRRLAWASMIPAVVALIAASVAVGGYLAAGHAKGSLDTTNNDLAKSKHQNRRLHHKLNVVAAAFRTGIAFTSTAFHGSGNARTRTNYDLYVMSAKGTKVRQLTNTPGDDSSPDWSPDGSRIAFHSNRTKGGDYEIYVVNSDGTDLKRLTKVRHGIDNTNPVWSPDGHKIAFTQNRNHHQDVLVMDSAGNHVRRLTHDSFYDAFPTWSPDGKEIAFMSCRPLHSGCEAKIAENIWTISSNGQGHPRRLTNTPSVNEFAPRWSKNRIVFFGERKNSPSTDELYIINADGTGLTRLTHNRWLDAAPAWSGDGTRIVFYSNRDGDDEIYWMQAKRNTTAHQLTHNSLSDQFPAWSPIGSSNP